MKNADVSTLSPGEDGSDNFADAPRVELEIRSLSEGDWTKLGTIASYLFKVRALKNTWAEPGDLLQEAVTRTLQGERRWRLKKVSFIYHLARTMESISGHLAENRERDLRQAFRIPAPLHSPNPEKATESKERLNILREWSAEIPHGWDVLLLKAEGKSASEIQCQLSISSAQYEATRKRIERLLIRYAGLGGYNGD